MITGVLSAWQDAVPCVFISGQNILSKTSRHTGIPLRTYGQQEADIVPLVKPITKYAYMLESADEIFRVMDEALEAAQSGRKGPVWVDVPLDLQSVLVEVDGGSSRILHERQPETSEIAKNQVDDILESLAKCKAARGFDWQGYSFGWCRVIAAKFVKQIRIPVTYSASAPDVFGAQNELSIGSVGAMDVRVQEILL